MKKNIVKIIAVLCLVSMAIGVLSACSTTEEKTKISVSVSEKLVDTTKNNLDEWLTRNGYSQKYEVNVVAKGENEISSTNGADALADVYVFPSDRVADLVEAGLLTQVDEKTVSKIKVNNTTDTVAMATFNNKIYAYPLTADNGYFMYYDKSALTDVSSLEKILEQCSNQGKKFCMDLESGWYSTSFFFGTGCDCSYQYKDGNIENCICNFNSAEGLAAFKAMINLASDQSFLQSTGENADAFNPSTGNAAAVVSGTWDEATAEKYLGSNMGVSKLPTFTVDGQTYQMSGFCGAKLIGIKPQEDAEKLDMCNQIAQYLSGKEMQMTYYEENNYGPANNEAQNTGMIKSNPVLNALSNQFQYMKVQGQYPESFWTIMNDFGKKVTSGTYKNASDSELYSVLAELETAIKDAK